MGAAASVAKLNRRWGVPGVATVTEGNGGLLKVSVTTPEASGEIYLHGATVTSWKPASREEVLFVSAKSKWQDGAAIRGGVPICFPWFGAKVDDAKAPAHGFARTKSWQLDSVERRGDRVAVNMVTQSDESTKKWWSADFRLAHRVVFGQELRMELALRNSGSVPLRFEEALHTYFRVGDVGKVRVHGLDGLRYTDKTDSRREKMQRDDVVIASETDREYLNAPHEVQLHDPVLRRRIRIVNENSLATVVWNPWADKARAMSDFGDDEWKQMICVETANVSALAVDVAPEQEHRMTATIQTADL